jgi:hypothetical protein
MARTTIQPTDLTKTGYNLTDSADFTTLSTGDGNGITVGFDPRDVLVLRNDTGGPAVFTLKVPGEDKYSDKGITVPDEEVTVASGEDWVYQLTSVFKQGDGKVYIDCDVAGKVLVLSPF